MSQVFDNLERYGRDAKRGMRTSDEREAPMPPDQPAPE